MTTQRSSRAGKFPLRLRQLADVTKTIPLFVAAPLYRHWHLRWGATAEEVAGPTWGRTRARVTLHRNPAITIEADPELVWPWLVQVGFRRAGFYTYDLLDSLGEPSVEKILPEWQHPRIGDVAAPMTREATPSTSFRVAAARRPEYLVWSKPDSTWAWQLTRLPLGQTRLVARLKQRYRPGPSLIFVARLKQRYRPGPSMIFTVPLMEFGDFPMMRKMLQGIKARAGQGGGLTRHRRRSVTWGDSRLLIYLSIAATGAGLQVAAYVIEGVPEMGVLGAVLAVALPVLDFELTQFALYGYMMREFEVLHIALIVATMLLLATALALAALGVSVGPCLTIVTLSPAVVVGYETNRPPTSSCRVRRALH
jgi:hypothetical protein